MMRFCFITLVVFALALKLTALNYHQDRDQRPLLAAGFGLLYLQSASPVAPLRLQQLQKVLIRSTRSAS